MHKTYEILFKLHEIDKEVSELKQTLQSIPVLIKQKQEIIQNLSEQLDNAKKDLKQQIIDQNLKEVELKQIENKISDCQVKSYSVKTNKEYDALQHEISYLENKKDNLQNEIINFLCKEDDEKARIKSLEITQKQENQNIDQELKLLNRELETAQKKLDFLLRERDCNTDVLDEETKSRYFLIHKNRKGIATSILNIHSCAQCGIRIRPQIINEIRSNTKVCFCDGCNRILLYGGEQDI